ncbi:MAG: hypothetical protein HC904_17225 [Blastochloris sp.]|nr:hypothetical protein [Blastochloris sp.]
MSPDLSSATKPRALRIAIIGQPNTGKSSLFNRLTGMRQRVGNYSGVTVERKEGLADWVRMRCSSLISQALTV